MARMLLLRTFSFCLLVVLLQPVSSGGQGTGGGSVVAPRGRFSTTDHMQCTWTANDTGDSVTVRVRCQNPQTRSGLRCSYRGAPRSCAAFRSEPRRFWKQVGRALTKLRAQLCSEGASVRAGMCRRAPGDARFELEANSVFSARTPAPAPPPSPTSTSCTGHADHRSTAEEYCRAWASVCSFLLSMLQTDAC
ncbi:fibroblast growth factor-binding protein 1-like [Nematolebias whitei]|uniref:fibroblast growth factor-binding protein 1-like n=1 Tax=Nematolebias whitei TaxID=451745 RepID=UPI00189C4BF9|nr:fibroblast growth factor-binding protein 1-like [Nematolebias whitei]